MNTSFSKSTPMKKKLSNKQIGQFPVEFIESGNILDELSNFLNRHL